MKSTCRLASAVTAALLLAGCAASSADKPDESAKERPELTQPADASSSDAGPEDAGQVDAEQQAQQGEGADPSDGPVIRATGPVAVVDGEEISAQRFNEAIANQLSAMMGKMPSGMAVLVKNRTLERLIDEVLIDARLEAAPNITVSAKEVDDEYAEFIDRFPSQEAYKEFLRRKDIVEKKMREDLKKDLKLRVLLRRQFDLEVTDQDVQDFYDSNLERYEQPEQVHARHILIKLDENPTADDVADARQRAEELARRAKEPNTDFAALAKAHSEGPSASQGGDLGFFAARRMVAEFSKAAFALNPGDISLPVRTQFGFHIIKVIDKKAAGRTPFSEAKPSIREQLEREKMRGAVKKLLADLEANATIERMPDNIEINFPKGAEAKSNQ